MSENQLVQKGLRELPKDPRDFQLGTIFSLPKLEELPEEFELEPLGIKNQNDTDFCTAMATCGMSELQEEAELEPAYSFALGKMISGDPEEWGQDLRKAMQAHIKYGAIRKKDSPFSLENKDSDFLRRIENWPADLLEKAKPYKKQSFFSVSGPYDAFDNIRAAIWKFKDLKRAVGIGVEWSWDLREPIIPNLERSGSGHMIYVIGWKRLNGETKLVIQNSYGEEAGDNGKHYFPREIINNAVGRYGSMMFVDLPKEQAKFLVENGLSSFWLWFAKILSFLKII